MHKPLTVHVSMALWEELFVVKEGDYFDLVMYVLLPKCYHVPVVIASIMWIDFHSIKLVYTDH